MAISYELDRERLNNIAMPSAGRSRAASAAGQGSQARRELLERQADQLRDAGSEHGAAVADASSSRVGRRRTRRPGRADLTSGGETGERGVVELSPRESANSSGRAGNTLTISQGPAGSAPRRGTSVAMVDDSTPGGAARAKRPAPFVDRSASDVKLPGPNPASRDDHRGALCAGRAPPVLEGRYRRHRPMPCLAVTCDRLAISMPMIGSRGEEDTRRGLSRRQRGRREHVLRERCVDDGITTRRRRHSSRPASD